MSKKDSKSKKALLIELYIKEYLTKTQLYEMLDRVEKGER